MNDSQLQVLEYRMNIVLPEKIKNFLKIHAGGRPFINGKPPSFNIIHPDNWLQETWIENVPSYDELRMYNEAKEYLKEFVTHFGLSRNYVEVEYLFPFAYLPSGAVLIATDGKHEGKVYTVDNGDFGILLNADSLQQFWNNIYSADIKIPNN